MGSESGLMKLSLIFLAIIIGSAGFLTPPLIAYNLYLYIRLARAHGSYYWKSIGALVGALILLRVGFMSDDLSGIGFIPLIIGLLALSAALIYKEKLNRDS